MFEDAIIPTIFGVTFGVACTAIELAWPARPIRYRSVLVRDIAAFALYIAIITPIAQMLMEQCHAHLHLAPHLDRLPLGVRLAIYLVVADLGSYWLHRLMHTRHVWRFHKWHHSPTYLYWFAGTRATFQQQFLFDLPALLSVPIIGTAPAWVITFLIGLGILRNDVMHMNTTWRSNWLEWVFVTPRYHHIHHRADPPMANYGAFFTFWDRMFGTYLDPETVTELRFGTGEADNAVRLVLGV